MNISSQIIEVLDHLCSKFGVAIDWSQENVLPYLQELTTKYISWEIATSWVWFAFGAILFIIAVTLFILAYFAIEKDWSCDSDFLAVVFITIGICLCIPAAVIIMVQIGDILTCNYFPEKLIIEYVKALV